MGDPIQDLKEKLPLLEKIGWMWLISLMKAKPLDQWSVLWKKDEEQFYQEFEDYA